jgi:trans-AT polyketide synthase/acyltransferase/oxidoreductase domain-containing protein
MTFPVWIDEFSEPGLLAAIPQFSGTRIRAQWQPGATPVATAPACIRHHLESIAETVVLVQTPAGIGVATGGEIHLGSAPSQSAETFPLLAVLPPITPDRLGDPGFLATHRIVAPYMTGAMANGIASVALVVAISRAGLLGSFGAAGLSRDRVAQAIEQLQSSLGDQPFCVNLIHSPGEPEHEMAIAELLLNRRVQRVEASAYLDLTPAIVRYRLAGLELGPNDQVIPHNRVIAKVSRVEVATRFLSPPPSGIVQELLARGHIHSQQAEWAKAIPMCDDLTVEADSGGHTDNRPAITLLPTMLALRDRLQAQYQYSVPPRIGLAGGIATPAAVAAAFSMGAAYVVTGSINQACVEAGTSDAVRKLLAEAGQADVAMAPAADMFEMGVKLQVLKRGTMFAMRAGKLYELYRQYSCWSAIPEPERVQIEKNLFRTTFDEVWQQTRSFWQQREPGQLAKAESDPHHQLALVFRWYLGLSSRWANAGEPGRQVDYQIWCGPAMGAFNEWVKGSPLELPQQRTVVGVARNLLYGACLHLRQQSARMQGVLIPMELCSTRPRSERELAERFADMNQLPRQQYPTASTI